ncbi:MAG: LacI family DNA-binding transcriptional regulator [Pseudomonadota bacterium]
MAESLGVSSATVSNALSGKGRISAEMAERVRRRADEVGFRPSQAARALKTGRSGILGFVMPDLSNPLFPKLAQSVEIAATSAGYGVLIADSRGDVDEQTAAIERLRQRGVDGIVIVPHRGTRPKIQSLPAAVIHTPSDPLNTVSSDHAEGGRQAAQALIDLGHRDILILGGDRASEVQRDRIDGMVGVLGPVARHRKVWTTDGFPDIADLAAAGVTGVLTTSDLIALRVLGDAYQAGIKVPDDLSIIGFDDMPLATAVRPTLSTVAQDVGQIAEKAVTHLHSLINNEQSNAGGMVVPMTLTLRASTAAARHHQTGEPS